MALSIVLWMTVTTAWAFSYFVRLKIHSNMHWPVGQYIRGIGFDCEFSHGQIVIHRYYSCSPDGGRTLFSLDPWEPMFSTTRQGWRYYTPIENHPEADRSYPQLNMLSIPGFSTANNIIPGLSVVAVLSLFTAASAAYWLRRRRIGFPRRAEGKPHAGGFDVSMKAVD